MSVNRNHLIVVSPVWLKWSIAMVYVYMMLQILKDKWWDTSLEWTFGFLESSAQFHYHSKAHNFVPSNTDKTYYWRNGNVNLHRKHVLLLLRNRHQYTIINTNMFRIYRSAFFQIRRFNICPYCKCGKNMNVVHARRQTYSRLLWTF